MCPTALMLAERDDMERVWQHLYTEALKTPSEEVRGIRAIAC
jgi:hypothetical protein